jgi:hypothetical protein
MLTHQFEHFTPGSPMQREGLDLSVTFDDSENYDLACGTPASLALAVATERAFIAFKASFKGLSAFFQIGATGAEDAIQAFQRRGTRLGPEALPKHRDTIDKELQRLELFGFGKAAKFPSGFPRVFAAAPAAFEATVGKAPSSGVCALRAFSHVQTCLSQVRFG